METHENLLSAELQIDTTSQSYLLETAKWGTFLSILGFIMTGIIALIAIFISTIFNSMTRGFGGAAMPLMGTTFITVFYLIIAVVNFFMSFYLFKFSSKMKAALYANDQDSLNESFKNQRSMFRLIGILTIIYLGFIILAIVFGALAAAFR
jgi:Family of unknown function (DUF5362)